MTVYQQAKQLSKTTVDNVRRILSSFFAWLEDEDYIVKSPVRRIHKVMVIGIDKFQFIERLRGKVEWKNRERSMQI